jgi:transcriptional regulator
MLSAQLQRLFLLISRTVIVFWHQLRHDNGERTSMYIPKLFHETSWPAIRQVIEENSFATIVSCNAGVPTATHAPLRLVESEDGTAKLQGHVSKANPHWRLFEEAGRSLVIFAGPNSYVSPRWYDHVNVPTWNYIAIHVYGKPRLVSSPEEMRELMKGLVDRHEGPAETGHAEAGSRYTLEGLPPDFLESQMKGIIGFEIQIDEIQASFKLSQNRDQRNYDNVIAELQKTDDQNARRVAEVMSNRRRSKP